MNAQEATRLAAIVAELCPRQKMTERTGAVWSMVLHAIPYEQAEAAVFAVYAQSGDDRQWSRTIEPDAILRECKRQRAVHRRPGRRARPARPSAVRRPGRCP